MLRTKNILLLRSSRYLLCHDPHARRLPSYFQNYPSSHYTTTPSQHPHQSHQAQPHHAHHSGAHSHEHYVPLTHNEVAARDKFDSVYSRSVTDPEGFWGEAAENIVWHKKWTKVYEGDRKWFAGGLLNTCFNCLDIHKGKGTALIYDSPVTKTVQKFTFDELLVQVKQFAGVLRGAGVKKGDVVIIYMPMIPQAVIAMLACARIGAIHSVVFGGFASGQLASRISHAKPKIIVSASGGIEPKKGVVEYKPLLDEAIEIASHKPEKVIIYQRENFPEVKLVQGRDQDWESVMKTATPVDEPEWVESSHPLYILYTSGTTGTPKGIVRDNGGHAVALRWSMEHIMNTKPGEVYFAASDIGWVVGHTYIVYAPLLRGSTTVLYEGKPVGTPDPGQFWRMVDQHKISSLFCAPTAIRAIKREDPNATHLSNYSIDSLRILYVAGERGDPDTIQWGMKHLKVPVVDNWWQTETGWPIASTCVGIAHTQIRPGSPGHAVPGYKLAVLDEEGNPQTRGKMGEIVIKEPLPPGCLMTLLNNEQLCRDVYFSKYPGYYKTGDAGFLDRDDYVWVMARTDDVINVAGHRLSTGQLEEVVAHNQAVAECAVVGVEDSLKGELPLAFIVLKVGTKKPQAEIKHEIIHNVRKQIGAVASLKAVLVVDRLPKTRSGKILRGTIKKLADGVPCEAPPTIEDASVLDEIRTVLTQGHVAPAQHS